MKLCTRSSVLVPVLSIIMLASGTVSAAQDNADFEWPRLLVIGAAGTSSSSFAFTNGWAPVLQKQVGSVVRVVPEDNDSMRYRRLTERRDITISSVSSADMRFQIEGIDGYAATRPAAQRVLWHGNDTPWGFVTSGDSKLQSLEDLKKGGYRVAKGVFAPAMVTAVADALPAFIGLSDADAKKALSYVPVSSYAENCRSVVEGKADVAYCSPVSSVLSEMEGAPGGIRWLPMNQDNQEGWAQYLKHRPMVTPSKMEMGVSSARGVEGSTSNFVYAVPADTDEEFAYQMAKWFHQSYDTYKGTHPLAARMSLEQFRLYLDRSPLPVHEGTVKYLREIGAWSEQDDAWNEQAKNKMDQWVQARQTAMTEAAKAGVKMDFQNQAFLDILNQHTRNLEGFKSRL
ncbi:TAXI family TRAP transporter solute-binding subunit [Alloalcanivorax xenomutans]|jgi:TRAP transporter TAXI family solute receptor|uniref:TAXI family TRAP transporter solute-binding subunit n=1 Tax=Alloalcanivorax xenomutans TaxID=1094342 RepID=UPI0007A767E0|nr:TAXI family TRAP transporter solute-binding subunit [Alloalcanivorax xenomutans]KYZ87325.1 hypothetical protein A3Q32_13250 [Alcanivorax sp. KX64203]WOA29644.1 TAXI family TRAP transporter solute-binding subunit [Alloalcanivorax xenomutans]